MARTGDKKGKILVAAKLLILRNGLRGTSMEAIARAAGIAKPTLYVQFGDKEAVFAALIDQLINEWRAAFLDGLRGEGDVVSRISTAVANKHKAALRLLSGSPHAEELSGEQDRLAAAPFRAFEAEVTGAIERELTLAGAARPRPLAQMLLAAAAGISGKVQSVAELGPAIRLLTERLLRPDLP
ncbi:MAG: TetR/AcrR family transcriptional regulator [Devosia sp.]